MNRVEVFNAHPHRRLGRDETIRLARGVLKGEGCLQAEIAIVFVDDTHMVKMNSTYLHHRYPTDVLSFSLGDEGTRSVEGEVYVNVDQAKRQALEYRVSSAHEVRRLVIHGLLHLLAYDDRNARRKKRMTKTEDLYLREFSNK